MDQFNVGEKLSDLVRILTDMDYVFQTKKKIFHDWERKEIQNDIVYRIVVSSLNKIIIDLCNFNAFLMGFLNKISSGYLNEFSRTNRLRFKKENDGCFNKLLFKQFDEKFYRIFPDCKIREEGCVNQSDINLLKLKIDEKIKPIKDHRDTIAAHWDMEPKPTSLDDIENYIEYIKKFLNSLTLQFSIRHISV